MTDRVVVIEPMGVGGICHYTYCLCQALAISGVNTSLITAKNYELAGRPHGFRLYPILKEWGLPERRPVAVRVAYRPTRLDVLRRRLGSVQAMLRIVAIVLRERAPVVHLEWPIGPHDWLYLTALRLLGRRVIYTAHDVLPHEDTPEDPPRLRRLLRQVDRAILHSHENDAAFHRIFRDDAPPTRVVPHGNYLFFSDNVSLSCREARAAVGVPLESRVVLFFGGIRPYKGLKDLIGAFGLVRKRVPETWLVIAGCPFEEFTPYEEAIAAAGIRECTAIHLDYHAVDDVGKFFRAADVVVLPYRSASQSGVAQLALAFGIPVVGTRVGGLPEVIEDGGTGLLVSPGDENGLAEAMTRLLTDERLSHSMSARAAELAATRYSWRHIAEMTRDVYDTVRSHAGARVPSLE